MSADHPVLFSGAMVRAILAGTKTQTRRVIPEPKVALVHGRHSLPERHFADPGLGDGGYLHWFYGGGDLRDDACAVRLPFRASIGDRLWVRETCRAVERSSDLVDGVLFAADDAFVTIENTPEAADQWCDAYNNGRHGTNWRPSIFMPRWASRITLEVTSVRVERLQDISEEDAKAEGVPRHPTGNGWSVPESDVAVATTARRAFMSLWERINGDRPGCSWEANPWVWAVGFQRAAGKLGREQP